MVCYVTDNLSELCPYIDMALYTYDPWPCIVMARYASDKLSVLYIFRPFVFMGLHSCGPLYLWPSIDMCTHNATEKLSDVVMALWSYCAPLLWPYVVMALHSYGPIFLLPSIEMSTHKATERLSDIVMALCSHDPIKLCAYKVMALYSYCPI